jgi:hypothetical protein
MFAQCSSAPIPTMIVLVLQVRDVIATLASAMPGAAPPAAAASASTLAPAVRVTLGPTRPPLPPRANSVQPSLGAAPPAASTPTLPSTVRVTSGLTRPSLAPRANSVLSMLLPPAVTTSLGSGPPGNQLMRGVAASTTRTSAGEHQSGPALPTHALVRQTSKWPIIKAVRCQSAVSFIAHARV